MARWILHCCSSWGILKNPTHPSPLLLMSLDFRLREELKADLGRDHRSSMIKVKPRPKSSHHPLSPPLPTQWQLAAELPNLMRAGVSPDWVNPQSVSLPLSLPFVHCIHCISPFHHFPFLLLHFLSFFLYFCSCIHFFAIAWRSVVEYTRKFAFIFPFLFSSRCTTSLTIQYASTTTTVQLPSY